MNITKTKMNMIFVVLFSIAVIFSFGIGTVSADQSQIYVNPAGNDSWNGQYATWQNTTFGPKQTIKNATGTVATNGNIYVANGTYNENNIAINRNMSIIGENRDNTIINGTNTGRIFGVTNGANVLFANLTLTNGNTTAGGGAISVSNSFITVKNCVIKNNLGGPSGGAIYSVGSGSASSTSVTVIDSTFQNNNANTGGRLGGAIINGLSTLNVINTNFISNTAGSGGAIYNNYGVATIQFSRFIGNTATTASAIYSDTGINAQYNWWGSNTGPATGIVSASVTTSPWLVLRANNDTTLAPSSSSIIMGNLLYDSNGIYHNPINGHVPDGIPVTFAVGTGAAGSVNPLSGTTLNGLLITNFTAGGSTGVSHPTFTVDGVIATGNVNIASVTPTNIVVGPASGNNGNSVDLIATLTNGGAINGQTVNFYVNGGLVGSAATVSGTATLPYTIVQGAGIYQILAQFLGTGTYSGSTGINNLIVNYIPTNLLVNGPGSTNYRDVVNLTATLTNSTGGALYDKMVYFNVNGNFAGAAKTNVAGIATVQYTLTQGAGVYQLLATFLADAVYAGSNATNSFTLNPSTTNLTVDPKTGYYNNTVSLTANLIDTTNNIPVSGKIISFYVNGAFVNTATTAANGVATLSYAPLLGQGIYEIFAQFAPTTTGYTGSNGTNNLTINLTPTAFYIGSTTVYAYYNNTVNLTARLRDNNYNYLNGRTVSFSVNGAPIGSVVTNTISGFIGTATIPFTANLTPGSYQVLVQFAGDSMYNASNATYNLTVNYNPTKLNVTAKSGNYNGKVNLTATLKDILNNVMSGKTVYFYLNNGPLPVGSAITDLLGLATYEYTITQGAGVYPILAQFLTEGGYNASNSTNNLTVSPAQAYLSLNPASGYMGNDTALTATLWDINAIAIPGKFIDFYVNNILQGTSQTDINGVATWIYTITQSAGVYPGFIKAVFAGDPYYVGATSFNTLNVTPDTTPPTVNANPVGGLYNATQNVVLASNEPSIIYYTTDGTDPTTGSTQYTVPIVINANTVLKFFAVDTAGNPSGIYNETYTIDTVSPITSANPAGGLYNTAQNVVLSVNEPSTIYYTTDGTDPTTGSSQYIAAIVISANTVLKFFAVDTAGNPSGIYNETYTIDTVSPTASATPAGGLYNSTKLVTLSMNKPGTIYYTLNGTTPTTTSTIYTGPITMSTTTTLMFFAVDLAGNPSQIHNETYIIDMIAPRAGVDNRGGLFNSNKATSIWMSEAGTIYYTRDGSTPTTASTKYTGSIVMTSTTTLKFIAVDLAGNTSPVYTEVYTIDKTAPRVTSTYPRNSITGASRGNTILIKFSENIKNSINWSKIYIKDMYTGRLISFSKWISGNTLYLKTGYRFSNRWYQVYIPTGAVKDYAGNNGYGVTFTFKTGRY